MKSQVATKPAPSPKEPIPPPPVAVASAPPPPSPQEFYAKVIKRPDVREILRRLAGA